jgi:hypothetical protein
VIDFFLMAFASLLASDGRTTIHLLHRRRRAGYAISASPIGTAVGARLADVRPISGR